MTNGILTESIWFNSQITGGANLYYSKGQCITSRFLNNSALFSGVCNSDGTYSVILKKIERSQHRAKWTCSGTLSSSNTVAIKVLVPATSAELSQHNGDYMKEFQEKKISCSTSACRPDPRVQWYLRSYDQVVYNLTHLSTNKDVNGEYGLKAVESVLTLCPNRTMNYLRLYCEVWTQSEKADKTSRETIVNVTYPPDNSPLIQGVGSNDAIRVIESDKGSFVCSITGGNPLALLSWNCFDSHDSISRTQDSTVTSTVKWTALRNYSTCSCTSNHKISNWQKTTNITVNVQYPPTTPRFTIGQTDIFGDVRVIQNNIMRVVCNSESNPLSNYTWTGPCFSGKGDTLEITSVKISKQGNYKCLASNRMARKNSSYGDGSNSSSLILTVLYPPSDPKFKFENSSGQLIQSNIFYVVINDTFSIYCDVKGNPVPDIKWDDNKSNPILSISNILLDINSTCRATNLMKETASQKEINSKSEESFSVIVSYPPGLPTLHISNYNGDSVQVTTGNVSVIESETINMTCFSTSKPMPTYKWIYEQYMKTQSTNVLKFFNISRHESGTYACNVKNNMKRSIGKTEVGKNKSQIKLNILYPSIVKNIHDVSIVEGSQLETLCPVVDGNPSNSRVTWSKLSDETQWNNRQLFIKNVSRADDANYTCSVIEMHPTIGRSSKIERRKSFHLNVFFPSEINTFTISTISSGRTFVVNRTQNPSFECIAEANPTSDLKIKSPWGGFIIEVSKTNIAHHTLHNASFKDAGEYICTGKNNYTRGSPSQSKLILIVKSRPRPSSGDTSAIKVATVLNVDVTLLFTAWNYLDKPNKTMFRWFKENVSISDNDNKYMIHSSDVQTNITIRNTTQQDLGLYKVVVENSVGMYTHFYELKATDKPETPKDFRLMNDTITDTSVALSWQPGFNGGFQQTFVIIYKMIHELVWLNKSIKDNGDINMNYILNDLSSLQEYEIEMFARNIEGNSLHTERLRFKTKTSIYKLEDTKTTHSSNTGLLVGVGVGASVTTLAFIAVAFIGYRRFKNMRHSRHDSPKSGITVGVNATSNYTDLDTSRRDRNVYDEFNAPSTSPYERLNTSTRELTTYMELNNTTVPNADTSDYVNIRI
ncbi:hemicentin-1-like [Ruditapes philippinarum]|uniref:hemicentin-1-like n=1 Tax=Ruditapes philippinarum TaxID=129788 RepID=UPI00295B898D|nr:hemicentin-1-like [Ruditapes philippinarum]